MTLTLPSSWHTAYQRSTVTPIVLVRLMLDRRRVLRVYDGVLGAGENLEIGAFLLGEGIDFTAGSPNSAVAISIEQGFNAQEDGLPNDEKTGLRALAIGDDVYFTSGALSEDFLPSGFEDFPIVSDAPDFAAEVSTPPEDARFVSGDDPVLGYPCCIVGLTTASASVDPFTRSVTIGAIDIEFGDHGQAIRELVRVGHRMYLSRVEVYVGTPELLEGNYALLGTFVISEVVPEPGKVTLRCLDAAEEGWKNRTIGSEGRSAAWVARHPLQIVDDIFVSKLQTDDVVDLTTLDPTLYEDISHFVVSRYHDLSDEQSPGAIGNGLDNAITDNRNVVDVLEQLFFMCGGLFIPDNTGLYGYRHFDIDASPVRTWSMGLLGETGEGFDCDLIEVMESVGKLATQVKAAFAKRGSGEESESTFKLGDRQAYIAFGRDVEETLDLFFCNGYARLRGTASGGALNDVAGGAPVDQNRRIYLDSTRFLVWQAGRQGFCGARYDWNGASWDLADGCDMGGSTGRFCVLRISPPGRVVNDLPTETEFECIAVDGWFLSDDTARDEASVGLGGVPHPDRTFAIIAGSTPELDELGFGGFASYGRGGLGTSPPGGAGADGADYWAEGFYGNSPAPQCEDITIPTIVAQRVLRRFRFGAPRIRTRTSLEHMDLELGDFVAIEGDELFIGHRRIGLNTSIVWEIVGKNVDVMADSPGIVWDLAFVRDDAHAFVTPLFDPPGFVLEQEVVAVSVDRCDDVTTIDEPPTVGGEADFLQLTTNLGDGQSVLVTISVTAVDANDLSVTATWAGTASALRTAGSLTILESLIKSGSGAIVNDPTFVDVGGQLWLHAIGTDSLTIQWHACLETRVVVGP